MKIPMENGEYDTLLQITDWRYSAALVGVLLYLKYFKCSYKILNDMEEKPKEAICGFDGILYNQSDITEERFLQFAEYYFKDDMTHLKILNILNSDELDNEKIKKVNDMVKSKSVLKNIFGKEKLDESNKELFISQIRENRQKIIKEIFRNGKNMYSNYCNTNLLFTQENPHCRLVGYNVDEGRKTKYLGFCFSKDSFVGNDILEFDFIPFAFSNTFESYFINNNCSVVSLLKTKERLDSKLDKVQSNSSRIKLITALKEAEDFVDYDVEIIMKHRDDSFYKTFYVRSDRLKALKSINSEHLGFVYEITKDHWLNVREEVYNRCLNNVSLDSLIEYMLKIYYDKKVIEKHQQSTVRYQTGLLIDIDEYWKGDLLMDKENLLMDKIDSAKKMGYIVSKELIKEKKGNKISSYKQKIIGALVAHDYDRVNEVILSLAAYVGMEFNFAYALFEDPEENKNIAFAFANALNGKDDKKDKEN